MKTIQEVIVVEGKDDTKQIAKAVNADTIETRGSAVPEETLALIEEVAEKRGVIIFTDPDFSGEKIRKTVAEVVPNAKHAFLPKKAGLPSKAGGSLGVEHASPDDILTALDHLYTETAEAPEVITQEDLLAAGLVAGADAKARRAILGETLRIGYVNGKQLKKRLKMFQITKADFEQAVAELDERG